MMQNSTPQKMTMMMMAWIFLLLGTPLNAFHSTTTTTTTSSWSPRNSLYHRSIDSYNNNALLLSKSTLMSSGTNIAAAAAAGQPPQQQRSTSGSGGSGGSRNGGAEQRRQQSLDQGHHPLISLNLNLDSLAQSAAASRAQELLQRIHALYKDGYYEVSPDTVSYNSVLKAWKEEDNPEQAYELLQTMIQQQNSPNKKNEDNRNSNDDAAVADLYGYNDDDNNNDSSTSTSSTSSSIQADVVSFNTVILAFARQGNYIRAQELLQQMKDLSHLPNPDTVTYNAVLYSLAESPDKGGASQAEQLLKEMLQPASNVIVDTTSFNTVLHAWAQEGGSGGGGGGSSNTNRNSAQRAQLLLNHMEQLAAAGNINVIPDVYSYTTVIQAWAKCERPVEAQAALDSMKNHGLEPNRYTYTAVMSSLAKSGEADRAEKILEKMMLEYNQGNDDMKPDTIAFSSVMDGWAKKSSVETPEAADRALQLLKRMEQLEGEGMGPNARTYTSILTALAKSGTWDACTKARALLYEMERQSEYEGKVQVTPSTIHYNVVLNSYARSPRADKALKASGLFFEMEHHINPQCRPDIISYNSLLLACSNAFGNEELRQKSYLIAVDAFKAAMQGKHTVRPTSTTFANFCRASRRLVNPSQRMLSLLSKTFKLCCERGLVNKSVLLQIKTACSTQEDWEQVIGSTASGIISRHDEQVHVSQFPSSWTCHARR